MDSILDDRIFLSGLSTAKSSSKLEAAGITHILSVCPDYPSSGSTHKTILVDDSEFENLLIHLRDACDFIQASLDEHPSNKVLVHCYMGVSRSVTVVAAYLMKANKWPSEIAVEYIRARRPQAYPNHGFRKQLDVFAACDYSPSPNNSQYTQWLQEREDSVTDFMQTVCEECSVVVPNHLFLSIRFSEDDDPGVFAQLLTDFGICSILSVAPSQFDNPITRPSHSFHHISAQSVESTVEESVMAILADSVNYITNIVNPRETLDRAGRVVLHCSDAETSYLICCAYLMATQSLSPMSAMSLR
ncbi:protein-tyrosine phosphatase-like protein [Flagelloscypha sp. PMI_526]|nr:protein-tyrosine phosphatase-like protein [Flagelloscypha sp. PMI_526]